jgi:hypothetical protein
MGSRLYEHSSTIVVDIDVMAWYKRLLYGFRFSLEYAGRAATRIGFARALDFPLFRLNIIYGRTHLRWNPSLRDTSSEIFSRMNFAAKCKKDCRSLIVESGFSL